MAEMLDIPPLSLGSGLDWEADATTPLQHAGQAIFTQEPDDDDDERATPRDLDRDADNDDGFFGTQVLIEVELVEPELLDVGPIEPREYNRHRWLDAKSSVNIPVIPDDDL
jgi:hypothetical protein